MKQILVMMAAVVLVGGCGKKEPSISRDEIVELETRKALRHRFDSNPASKGAIIDSLVLQKEGENKYVGSVEITDPDGSKIKLDLEVTDHGGKIFFETKMPQKSISEKPESLPDNLIVDPILEKAIRKSLKKPEGELTEADLEKVTSLGLSQTKITDEGLKEVAKLQELQRLFLHGTKITNAGLKEVAKLHNLKHLWLDNTRITDAGLMEIAKLQKLEILWLFGTQVTDAGVAELKKALPNCSISGP